MWAEMEKEKAGDTEAETGLLQPQPGDIWCHQELRGARKEPPLELQREHGPVDTEPPAPELRENTSLLF